QRKKPDTPWPTRTHRRQSYRNREQIGARGGRQRHTSTVPFNLDFGDLVLVLTIVAVVFGATKVPDSRGQVRAGAAPAVVRWSRLDWALVIAALVSVAVAGAALTMRR